MKKSILNLAFLLLGIISFLGCKKKEEPPRTPVLPTVVTSPVTSITTSSALCGGEVITDGGSPILDRGLTWGTAPNPIYAQAGNFSTNDGSGTGKFISNMVNGNPPNCILPGTTYFVRAWARNSDGIAYGNEQTFTTPSPSLATITTATISAITETSAVSGGDVISDGGAPVLSKGVCWSTSPNPTSDLSTKSMDGGSIGLFTSNLLNLLSNTTYYVRAYATNSIGTSYGNEIIFTTNLGVGDSYQGGVIAYVLQPGDTGYDVNTQHGIIAAATDQSASAPWALTLTSTGANAQTIGSGKNNTNAIVSNQGAGTYAAALCDNLVLGGYSDWHLPSLNELTKLFLNKDKIGGFAVAFYWSSSEDNTNTAWTQSFNSNSQAPGTKTTNYNVRAVRYF
ncbi:DUF1566 domain-containing protein [Aurantibacillus circumpalustris]|uniref:DUF1566 domain-containing protein n=1 Tax=Aurantibacillus circumpalustris TaxID=3036359 RepID=UPI00295BA1BD|nr:DUF1566 domain-containing protein [Aurantibacillus circumpalustris]